MEEKVYYDANGVRVSNKVWCIGGIESSNSGVARGKIIPVDAISSVDFTKNRWWWLLILLALYLIPFGIYMLEELWDETPGIVMIIIGLVCLLLAYFLWKRRGIEIHTHNLRAGAFIKLNSKEEAEKMLNSMAQCLIEREQV